MSKERKIGDSWKDLALARLPLLLGVLFLAALAGLGTYLVRTGPRRVAGEDREIRLLLAVGPNPAFRPALDEAIATFEKGHPHVEVKVLEVAGRYYQKILIMIAGRVAPDLMWMGQSFGEFADRGAFLDISDRLHEVDLSHFHPEVLAWYNLYGQQVGIPYVIDLQYVVYNKDLFDEAGVEYPGEDWDFEEFVEKARALTIDRTGDGRIDQFGFNSPLVAEAWAPPIIDTEVPAATVDTPERLEYYRTMLRLRNEEGLIPSVEDAQQESMDIIGLFIRGRYAMIKAATWHWQSLQNRCADMNWDVASFPKARRRAHWASSGAFMISADTEHPDEAWELNKLLFGDTIQSAAARTRGGVPPDREVARRFVEEHRGKPENIHRLVRATESMAPVPRVPHLQEFMAIYSRWSSAIMSGVVEPEIGLRRAQHDLSRAIEQARERGAFDAGRQFTEEEP